ncbi:MAG: HAD family hydrolase [Elusimicrobia bacterium]|nr:HAD family hydrolase [Elusimicrobiota bacterium]
MRWAAFLDRDGTIIDQEGFLTRAEDLRLFPGAAQAVKRLREAGGLVIVVTNQPAVARGLIDEPTLARIHERLKALFAEKGAPLDALYYCPHHPETHHPEASDPRYRRECECRKPGTGMLRRAADEFGIDIARSFMVGDSTRDVMTARNAGCMGVLVKTGEGGRDAKFDVRPDAVCDDILAAAEWIAARAGAK